jgi:hypothetical protein
MDSQVPVFIVDLNELEGDDLVPVAMDYTVNNGPGVKNSSMRQPREGEWVRVHSDADDTLYYAQVTGVVSERDLVVRIDWESCAPVLNRAEWSARDARTSMGVRVSSV